MLAGMSFLATNSAQNPGWNAGRNRRLSRALIASGGEAKVPGFA